MVPLAVTAAGSLASSGVHDGSDLLFSDERVHDVADDVLVLGLESVDLSAELLEPAVFDFEGGFAVLVAEEVVEGDFEDARELDHVVELWLADSVFPAGDHRGEDVEELSELALGQSPSLSEGSELGSEVCHQVIGPVCMPAHGKAPLA